MSVQISIIDLLIMMGMVTGIICSILLLRNVKKKPSNKFLALGLLAFVWLNTKNLLHSFNLWEIHGIGFFPNGVELALPPLFYFYLVFLLKPNEKFTRKKLIHFIPFFLSQVYSIIVYIAIMQTTDLWEKESIGSALYFNDVKYLEEYLVIISSLIYLYFGYRLIKEYKNWLAKNSSDNQVSELGFLRNIVFGMLFISAYGMLNLTLDYFLDSPNRWRWQISHLLIATLVYYMGLVGYKHADRIPDEFSLKRKPKPKEGKETVDEELIAKLQKAFETEKVYLNPKLSLQELANQLEANEAVLSSTINAHYKKNFRGLINSLRVKEVENRIKNHSLGNLSLLGLANECGFNSEASFYRIFKSTTGSTPKQFLQKHTSSTSSPKE